MLDTKEILLSFHSVRFVHLDTPIPTARFRNYLGKDELITLFGLAKHKIAGYLCSGSPPAELLQGAVTSAGGASVSPPPPAGGANASLPPCSTRLAVRAALHSSRHRAGLLLRTSDRRLRFAVSGRGQ